MQIRNVSSRFLQNLRLGTAQPCSASVKGQFAHRSDDYTLTGRSFLIDVGLNRAGRYIRRYVRPMRRFRLMDLPVELRIEIAKYALTSERPLRFTWLAYTPDKRIATFKGLEKLTALTRVSKQVRAETSKLVWSLNTTFKFDILGIYRGPSYRHFGAGPLKWAALEEAVAFTMLKGPSSIRYVQKIQLELSCYDPRARPGSWKALQLFAQSMESLSRYAPKVRWEVCTADWVIRKEDIFQDPKNSWSDSVESFESDGRRLARALAKLDATGVTRNWKVFPYTKTKDRDQIKHGLAAAGVKEGEAWIDEGL